MHGDDDRRGQSSADFFLHGDADDVEEDDVEEDDEVEDNSI